MQKKGQTDSRVPLLILGLGVLGGVGAAFAVDWGTGVAVFGAFAIGAGAVVAFRDPPSSGGGGNPAGIDFGR
jgi:hypothetical protein